MTPRQKSIHTACKTISAQHPTWDESKVLQTANEWLDKKEREQLEYDKRKMNGKPYAEHVRNFIGPPERTVIDVFLAFERCADDVRN